MKRDPLIRYYGSKSGHREYILGAFLPLDSIGKYREPLAGSGAIGSALASLDMPTWVNDTDMFWAAVKNCPEELIRQCKEEK